MPLTSCKPTIMARDVILEILRAAGGEWMGRTRLEDAFYYSHLCYSRSKPGLLTRHPILRMPHGPGIGDGDELIEGMIRDKLITMEDIQDGSQAEHRYRLTDEAALHEGLPEDARNAVDEAVRYCRDKSAAELSALMKKQSRTWRDVGAGETLDIYVDLVPDSEYEQRVGDIRALERQLFRDKNP